MKIDGDPGCAPLKGGRLGRFAALTVTVAALFSLFPHNPASAGGGPVPSDLVLAAPSETTAPPGTAPADPNADPATATTAPGVDIPVADSLPVEELTTPTQAPAPSKPPLVPVPTGCDPPEQPHVVFIGTVVAGDYRTKRFRIEQVRSGTPDPFPHGDGEIDIRYGSEQQYLEVGETYLVGAGFEPTLGILYSTVSPPIEDFGGDEVIGISETDVECLEVASAARTYYPDGSEVPTPVLSPVRDNWIEVAGAVATPLLAALGIIFVLALVGNGSRAAARIVTGPDQ